MSFVWRPEGPVDDPSLWTTVSNATTPETLREEARLEPLVPDAVWYRSLPLSRRVRAIYSFSSRARPTREATAEVWKEYMDRLVPDPLNSRTLRFPNDPEDPTDVPVTVSVLELPDAPSERWSRSLRPEEALPERQHLPSRILRGDRSVWVSLPNDFDPDVRPYNLLIVLDGFTYLHAVPTPRIVQNLVAAGRIGPTVTVLVGNPSPVRNQELDCNPKFARFLSRELLPWMRRRYGLTVPGRRTVVAGSSAGGLAAAFAAMQYPTNFGNVLAQSGAFMWSPAAGGTEPEWLIREFARARRLPVEFYLDAGTYEGTNGPDGAVSILTSVRHLRDVLRSKGYSVSYAEFEGGHDYSCWSVTLADGLIHLLGKPEPPGRDRAKPRRATRGTRALAAIPAPRSKRT